MSLRRIAPSDVRNSRFEAVDAQTLAAAATIVEDVRRQGDVALRAYGETYGDLPAGADAPLVLGPTELQRALDGLPDAQRDVLIRTADRIRAFATAQRQALVDIDIAVPGGRAGHRVAPVERAGCYAPGGRFPLPSSVLMTAVTARVAGVEEVWLASPRPTPVTLAAAAVAGVTGLIPIGGAQAIAALAHGAGPIPAVDVIVGPGNRWVTAAKQLVCGQVGIDMLAGPSELVVLADDTAVASTVAADLLAQAEHDPDARPILVTPSTSLADAVDAALLEQLAVLPTADTATAAVRNGFCVITADLDEAVEVTNHLAPEHLEVLTASPEALVDQLKHYGGLFVGQGAAEVFGDYGVGPNHVLPTGTTARFTGGLSVLNFLRVRTWLKMDPGPAAQAVARDAALLARMEGLEGHARSAEARLHDEAGTDHRP